jgi:hypothetical protein
MLGGGHIGVGLFCAVAMLPLALALRRPPPAQAARATALASSMVGVARPAGAAG